MTETSPTRTDAEPQEIYLRSTVYIDSDHPKVRAHAAKVVEGIPEDDVVARAVALFYDVRDGIRYNPYSFSMEPEWYKASAVLDRDGSFCVPKAVLLAALARAVDIPSRLGFADVVNHLASKRLLELMKTDVFAFHGFTELFIEGQWVKATSAFNLKLCERFKVPPLEFDGRHDALLQPFNAEGDQYMEYARDHGTFDDMPFELMIDTFREVYPHWFQTDAGK